MHELWLQWRKGDSGNSGRANLCNANLSGADLHETNLRDAELQGADLTRANLQRAELWGANLQGAILAYVELQGADLSGANLQRAELWGANLQRAGLWGANLQGASLAYAELQGAYLTQANLHKAILAYAKLQETDLQRANLREADLTQANLQEANLTRANLQEVDLWGADLQEANLAGARLQEATRTQAKLQGAFLRDLEREDIYLIEHNTTRHLLTREGQIRWDEPLKLIEGSFRSVFFRIPVAYGLEPGRALLILVGSIAVFALIYFVPLSRSGNGGIYRIWPKGRLAPKWPQIGWEEEIKIEQLRPRSWWQRLGTALQFSAISAFHLGWRDLNVGTWLSRLQTREYALQATGWVRTVAGLQSLLSVYLLAMWALTYFGRPFG
ncbi:MAG TPA: pentapeptide repeat-containing protein [Geminicoccus sp.]|jgi:uncharacterized protein YjbI with pentapeptide repeats|uniref:pentapeptide repeat-containing protein n=1 Tax=Geminicoccus sp. TaxID=2024832 RepID=UPI002E32C094|nr:pentapeptide repeat-containing protein [Geminicoccus sp.]HEX2529808.1 pentapeptide repeat-containing protein [Geminicoccus sp.]